MSEHIFELFILKCAPIQAAVEKATAVYDPAWNQATASIKDDPLLKDHLAQIGLEDRIQAERMAEYYKVFYALENYIRDFVTNVLAEEAGEDWWDSCVPEIVKESAKRARERELAAGVTPRSVDMLEYITFGELSEILKANMASFSGFFASVKGFEGVMGRLNTLRGPIMHCGVLAEDEVLRLKLSVRDWFKLFETGAQ